VTFLARVVVSRKTPSDGKLEIPGAVRAHLARDTRELRVRVGAETASATLASMRCDCAKAAPGGHEHHFVVCNLLRDLTPGTEVTLDLEEAAGVLSVTTT